MTLRELLLALPMGDRQKLATEAGTTPGYLRKLAYGQCLPSGELAKKLVAADARLSYADLFERRHKPKKRG